MSERKVNLREILDKCLDDYDWSTGNNIGIPINNAMKEACRQTLELASENFEIEYLGGNSDINDFRINKQSILDTINQVE